jgi:hypothetical protein
MNAESELLRAYREWRRLALAETKAIQTRNWRLLADCHLVIRDYQSLVSTLTRAARKLRGITMFCFRPLAVACAASSMNWAPSAGI